MTYILNDEGDILGFVDNYESLKWSKNLLQTGAFQMSINRNVFSANKLEKGRLILPFDFRGEVEQIFKIEQIESVIDEDGSIGELLMLTGRDISGITEERIGLPPENEAYDERSELAETLMKEWVAENIGEDADLERQIPNFDIAPNLGRGEVVSYAVRYQKLATILEEIGRAGLLGWQFFYDTISNEYIFDVIEPVDRTKDSPTPVFLDIDFETIIQMNLMQSELGSKNFAYIGGEGEKEERIIEDTFVTEDNIEPEGFDRKEMWVDAGSIEDIDNLDRAGKVELLKRKGEDILEVNLNQFGSFQYKEDFFIGDFVTVRNKAWGVERNLQIIGASIQLAANQGKVIVNIQVGNEFPTIKSQIELDRGTDARERV